MYLITIVCQTPTNMTDARSHTRETCAHLLLNSVKGSCKHAKPKNDPERAKLYKSMNNSIIAIISTQRQHVVNIQQKRIQSDANSMPWEDVSANMTYISDNLSEMVNDYVWLTRCCDNATEIADTFNSNHLAGLLVCKSFSLLCNDLPLNMATNMSWFFPKYQTIHVCQTSFKNLCYSELVFVVTSLQQKWDVLMNMDLNASTQVLVCCMARFGQLASMQLSSKILDDTQEREHANVHSKEDASDDANNAADVVSTRNVPGTLWVLSKRAIRHFTCTFVCMAREIALLNDSSDIIIQHMSDLHYNKFITDEVMAYGFKLAPDISENIRTCFHKIKSLRQDETQQLALSKVSDIGVGQYSDIPSAEKSWDFLLKKLGPHKMGPRPRKMNAEFKILLGDVIIALSDTYNNADNDDVTRSCLNIIQTALKYYYVVPSADRYREIVLMQNLCPGQRLNYAFDYMHFDTGIFRS